MINRGNITRFIVTCSRDIASIITKFMLVYDHESCPHVELMDHLEIKRPYRSILLVLSVMSVSYSTPCRTYHVIQGELGQRQGKQGSAF